MRDRPRTLPRPFTSKGPPRVTLRRVTAQALTLLERGERCLTALDDAGRAIARRVTLRLVGFGDAGPVSRQQPVSVLAGGGEAAAVADVLRRPADGGLVAIDRDAAAPDARARLAPGAIHRSAAPPARNPTH